MTQMFAVMRLALVMLRRDWRSGELRILLLALVVSVASVSCVGFVADRISGALTRDAMQLLGGDLLLVIGATDALRFWRWRSSLSLATSSLCIVRQARPRPSFRAAKSACR